MTFVPWYSFGERLVSESLFCVFMETGTRSIISAFSNYAVSCSPRIQKKKSMNAPRFDAHAGSVFHLRQNTCICQ